MTITSQKIKSRHNTVQGACLIPSSGSHVPWRSIPLTQGKFAIVDAKNYEWLNQWKWCAIKDGRTFYATRHSKKDGKMIPMHRQILNAPDDIEVDHVNFNGLDNRESNIRLCTKRQNQQNCRSFIGSSIYKGVSWITARKKWQATICFNGKNKSLGLFENEIEAAKTYDAKALELFGEFAHTNF